MSSLDEEILTLLHDLDVFLCGRHLQARQSDDRSSPNEDSGEVYFDGSAVKLLVGDDAQISNYLEWLNRYRAVRLG